MKYELITIVGPTASGKTHFAVALAGAIGTEIISADSRQVYRQMDLGTGKDLSEYEFKGRMIPYHCIDIRDAGYKYNVYEFQQDFLDAFHSIRSKGCIPILCGGTGMYVESVLGGFRLLNVPENPELRARLADKTLDELAQILASYKKLHNTTDIDTAKRAIREIEIQEYYSHKTPEETQMPAINSLIIGVDIDREMRRRKISERLKTRLDDGMLDEVRSLLKQGIPPENLIYYGLEYKYMTLYLTDAISYETMFQQLEIAIHQFAKRQMTWFRGMERRGFQIHWIDAEMPTDEKVDYVCRLL